MDKLNSLSYACHYRNLDSVIFYCEKQNEIAEGHRIYGDGVAERLNNEAFYYITKMEYPTADSTLQQLSRLTDNQVELMICYVQQMRLCQRRSRNKDFYDCRERALNCQKRINEELSILDNHQKKRLIYAETELAIVNSTYYYYVGLEQLGIEALMKIKPDEVMRDTAQFLNYLYNIGAGGILKEGTTENIHQQEMEYLLRCFQIAQREGYHYFMANTLEAIAEHLAFNPELTKKYVGNMLVNPLALPKNDLPIWLAKKSLQLFKEFGDIYQISGAYRTLASCYHAQGHYKSALENLELALADSAIFQAPDLVASIREQLSVAYAAINDKAGSDFNRNEYLNLQEQTRQDRQLEARVGQLDAAITQLNWVLTATAAAIILIVFLLFFFRKHGRRQNTDKELDNKIEERREQLIASQLHIEEGQRRNAEQRAKVSLVNSILPLIDRMVHEVKHTKPDMTYIRELTEKIESDNQLLTHWIQLRKGELSLHIESFPLQQLFDIMARSQKNFQIKGITLQVEPTDAVVKADKILTIFMLSTLSDNARKFTHEGEVTISAKVDSNYVEISVSDTGEGMSEEQLSHVFNRKIITDDNSQTSHGFGLLNCQGIIDKYRKLSRLFNVCTLQAESRKGRGSRFYFRLPRGVLRMLLLLFTWISVFPHANAVQLTPLSRAAIYADSVYFCNINEDYERTLLFADSCRQCLNEHYQKNYPEGKKMMLNEENDPIPAEIEWVHDSVRTNYNIILDVRNETAVAALALHKWQLYNYNNRVYTQLFKELSADETLADYCRMMQQTKANRTIALVMFIMVLLSILPLYYFYYLRPQLNARFKTEQLQKEELEMLDDNQRCADMEIESLHVSNNVLDNCLSTLKHETMYYPSRIRQLLDRGDMESVGDVVNYYRELYNLLSLQTMNQVERIKLHLKHLDHDILGDETLVRFLFDIIRKISGQSDFNIQYELIGKQYVQCTILTHPMHDDHDTKISWLICRQIVRDHGEITNRRACSIRKEKIDEKNNQIIILLPAYGKI